MSNITNSEQLDELFADELPAPEAKFNQEAFESALASPWQKEYTKDFEAARDLVKKSKTVETISLCTEMCFIPSFGKIVTLNGTQLDPEVLKDLPNPRDTLTEHSYLMKLKIEHDKDGAFREFFELGIPGVLDDSITSLQDEPFTIDQREEVIIGTDDATPKTILYFQKDIGPAKGDDLVRAMFQFSAEIKAYMFVNVHLHLQQEEAEETDQEQEASF